MVMVVTSAVDSVGFLHLQTRSSNINTGPFYLSTPRRNALLPCYLHLPNHLRKNNGCYCATSGTFVETSGADGFPSEVENIKQKYLKWQWKGQYSINYFVSSDSDSTQPPLLLVHGFGASIPHWRR